MKPLHKEIKIIMLGGPGCGKGTQSVQLAEKYKIKHLSTGEILRSTNGKCI